MTTRARTLLTLGLAAIGVWAATALAPASTPGVLRADCGDGCPAITVAGDHPAPLPGRASGYADLSLRRDPSSTRLWMAYSWPHTAQAGEKAIAVDTHLAHSDDGGRHWAFDRALWTSTPTTDPAGGGPAFVNNETVSLAPAQQGSHTTWWSIRLHYATAAAGSPRLTSFVLRVAHATTPTKLASATEQTLGGSLTRPQEHTSQDLALLDPSIQGCVFNDPALYWTGGRLYLAVECLKYTSTGDDFAHDFVALFSAKAPGGLATKLHWSYVGALTTRADAQFLGGQDLEQTDLARGRDGSLLLIVNPGKEGATALNGHTGCVVLRVSSLAHAQLERDGHGHPRVVAVATSSDSKPDGPGACAYDPGSATGLVVEHREIGASGLLVEPRASGLRP